VLAGLGLAWWWSGDRTPARQSAVLAVPEFTPAARIGREAFGRQCGQCHGPDGAGSDKGPTLIHVVYAPGHHADIAFKRAVALGVRAHHWSFGDMAALPSVTDSEIEAILRFVREMQRANGIR
jgi:mono/diheme cytochrome c family protein